MNTKYIVGAFVLVGVLVVPTYWIYQKFSSVRENMNQRIEEAVPAPLSPSPSSEAEVCASPNGKKMTWEEARKIVLESDCLKEGERMEESHFCNENSGTWWANLAIKKPGCSPACVVSVDSGQAEINWRCTGLVK